MGWGEGPGGGMGMLVGGGDGTEKLLTGQPPDVAFAFLSGFLCITTLLASYLRSLTVKAEVALHDRLVELQRLYADLAGSPPEPPHLDQTETKFLAHRSHQPRTPPHSLLAFFALLPSYHGA